MSDNIMQMQTSLDKHKHDIPDGLYLTMSNHLKDLFPLANLFQVSYTTFGVAYGQFAEDTISTLPDPGGASVIADKRTRIMAKVEHVGGLKDPCWSTVFCHNELPNDMRNCVLNEPVRMCHGPRDRPSCLKFCIVTSVEPYLKRPREDDSDDAQ